MMKAKLFKHGGSQAVRLPKAFRFEGSEVLVERRGDEVVLRSVGPTGLKTLGDVAKYMASFATVGGEFPAREQPKEQQKRELTW